MIDLPTVEDVYAQTDKDFHNAHPDAPEHLDADNPDHAQWVEEWGRIRVETCNLWTDQAFYDRYPIGRALDAGNPADAKYIEYWNDIRAQIDGHGGQYDWSNPPAAPSADEPAPAAADTTPAATPSQDDTPPTFADFERGEVVVQFYVKPIIKFGHEFAENLATLPEHPTAGVISAALEGFITGAEVFGADFPPVSAILGPFTMWLEAIGANDARERATNRWRVYNMFIAGFIGGLHMRDTGSADPAFLQPMLDAAFTAAANLSDADKKAVKAYLLEHSNLDGGRSLNESNPQMAPSKWLNHEGGWTRQGLEDVMTYADHQ